MMTATRIIDSTSGIAVPQSGNSGTGVLTVSMDELLDVKVVAAAVGETCVSVMNGG